MKNDKFYRLMVSKMQEIATIPPQNVGPFTSIYKILVPQFKFYPWKSALIISFTISFFLYLLFGTAIVRLASLLQYGF